MRFGERESAPQVKLQPYKGDFILGSGLPSNDTQVLIAISLPCPPLHVCQENFDGLQSLQGKARISGSNTCTVPADPTECSYKG